MLLYPTYSKIAISFRNLFSFWILFLLTISSALNSQSFTEQQNIVLPGVDLPGISMGEAIWGDYDNDDDLDILVAGANASDKLFINVYKNNGDNTFSEQTDILIPAIPDWSIWGPKIDIQWYDFDNDGFLDICYIGRSNYTRINNLWVYRNGGDNTFTQEASFTYPASYGTADVGDYDNDGDGDILIASIEESFVYQNEGGFTFKKRLDSPFIGVSGSATNFIDYNNDGLLDIYLSGHKDNQRTGALYKNLGSGEFEELSETNIDPLAYLSSDWGDYNGDGLLDLAATNYEATTFYRNNGDDSFTKESQLTNGLQNSASQWGDLDNDGDIDLIRTGYSYIHNNNFTSILINNGDNTFTETTGLGIDSVTECSIDLADYDNDGDLDILIAGENESSRITKVYKNDVVLVNPIPTVPSNLTVDYQDGNVILSWDSISFDNTISKSISYNIAIGTSPGGTDFIQPASSSSGVRKVPTLGNGQLDTTFVLSNLPKDTYYWKVQAVDNSYKGGAFSSEAQFTYSYSYQAYGMALSILDGSGVTVKWNRGNGEQCVAFIKEGIDDAYLPDNNVTYTSSDEFGMGSKITGSEWYCIYNGTGDSISIVGLDYDTDYIIKVFEYDGSAGNEVYNTEISDQNSKSFTSSLFTRLRDLNLDPVVGIFPNEELSFSYWIDFDNDDDLDLLLVGTEGSKLYQNEGSDQFNLVPMVFPSGISAACGDYNNDGYIDIIILNNSECITYFNKKDGTFEEQSIQSIPATSSGSVEFGDYDNDGDLDVSLTGSISEIRIARIYANNGDSTFTEQQDISLTGVSGIGATSKWADYDNDGDLDILISTFDASHDMVADLFRNDGNNSFIKQTHIVLDAYYESTYHWGDFNTDGYLDILMASAYRSSKIYKNNGDNSFEEVPNIDLERAMEGEISIGDYDNDGDPDILLTGLNKSYVGSVKLYQNQELVFTEDTTIQFIGVSVSSANFGDYDNDGDLDIVITGKNELGSFSEIYRNDRLVFNTQPAAPTGAIDTLIDDDVILSWNPVTSDETPYPAISYNVQIGTSIDGSEITSPHSGSDGFRRITGLGNAQLDTSYIIKDLPFNRYYWRVQAIDQNHAGSPFSELDSFDIVPIQASELSAQILSSTSLQLNWTRGNGDRCLVFCKQTGSGLAPLLDSVSYIGDTEYGFGKEIEGTGWYCVFNGRADSVIVSGLIVNKAYSFQIFEYIGGYGKEDYFSELSNGNPGVFSTGIFTLQSGMSFEEHNGYYRSTASWGDFNNDGLIDLLIPAPEDTTRIFENNGDNTFTERKDIGFDKLSAGSASWGDYDNDGDLDILLTGSTTYPPTETAVTKIYSNDGSDIFTWQSSIVLDPVYYSSGEWGDYDNDGDLDILITGATGPDPDYAPISKIYRNEGENSFTEQTDIELTGVFRGVGKWGDLDGDGDLDIILAGSLDSEQWLNNHFQILLNEGNNTFIEKIQSPSLDEAIDITISLGDYDNDSDLDLLYARRGQARVYENKGDASFEQQLYQYLPYNDAAAAEWGDYNADGFLDVLVTNPNLDSKLFRNTKGVEEDGAANDWFVQDDDDGISFTGNNHVSWVDYDNDGDLDFLFMNKGGENKLFRNNIIMTSGQFQINSIPAAPINLTPTSTPEGLSLGWDPVLDDETPWQSMSYNIQIGTVFDSTDILAPLANDAGYRSVVSMGNSQLDTSYSVNKLEVGKYYWKVQAVDQSFSGGEWSVVDSFERRNLQAFFTFDTVCDGFETSFTDQSVSTEAIDSWYWDFGDGNSSIEQSPTFTLGIAGTHQVKLVIESGTYKDSLTKDVLVYAKPTVSFMAENVCHGDETSYINTTALNGTTISTWSWNLGDGNYETIESPPAHGYITTGDYNIKLVAVATNSCSDSLVVVSTVAEIPSAVIATGGNPQFCEGDSIKLSVPEDAEYMYQWKLGGITIAGADSSVYYPKGDGDYDVTVTNTIGSCVSDSPESASIEVSPTPAQPSIQEDGPLTFCDGDSVVLSVSGIAFVDYLWMRDGGAVGDSESSLTVWTSGNYNLKVVSWDGCEAVSTNSFLVTVNPPPGIPNVEVSGNTDFCEGESVTLSVEDDPDMAYQWKKDDENIGGETANSFEAVSSGEYNLRITDLNGCSNQSYYEYVDVYPTPSSPVINNIGETSFCDGDSVILSIPEIEFVWYDWILNDNSTGEDRDTLVAWEAGVYKIEIMNYDGCTAMSTNSITVTVNPTPAEPDISTDNDLEFCMGDSVELSTESVPLLSYQWQKENNNILGANDTAFSAKSTGIYKLVVSNELGCFIESYPLEITTKERPLAPRITITGNTEFCENDSLILSAVFNPDLTYRWLLDEGPVGQDYYTYEVMESGNYSLEVENYEECTSISSNTVDAIVHDIPETPTVTLDGATSLCEGETAVLSISEPGDDNYQWMIDTDILAGETGTSLTIDESGTYSLRVRNEALCEAYSQEFSIEVYELPEVPLISTDNYTVGGCVSLDPVVIYVSNSETDVDYQWLIGGEISTGDTLSSFEGYHKEGTYKVRASINSCTVESDALNIIYGEMPDKPDIIAEGPNYWYLACSNDSATSYKWYYNDQEIIGANDYLYLAGDQLGKYEVSVSENSSCYSISDPTWIPLGTGVNDDPWAGLKIYPNPTPGKFTLEMDNYIMGELIIDIFNENGSKVINIKFQKETNHFETHVDLSEQPAAVYLIGLMLEEYQTTRSLIVE